MCCDRAGLTAVAHGLQPTAIVGDGDSLPDDFKQRYRHLWHHVSEQDDNDLTKATRYCISRGATRITYLAATGLREDHTIGNIFLLVRYARDFGVEVEMVTDTGRFLAATGTRTFHCRPGQQVSIFRAQATDIASTGLRWDAYTYDEPWQGTLNEATADTFTIHASGTYLVYLCD